MDNLGTKQDGFSSVPDRKEASDLKQNELDRTLDQALAGLYGEVPSPGFDAAWRSAIKREEQMQMKKTNVNITRVWKKYVLPVAAALVLIFGAQWAGNVMDDNVNMTEYGYTVVKESRSSKSADYDSVSTSGSTNGAALMSFSSADVAAADVDMGAGMAVEESVELAAEDHRKLIRTVDLSLRSNNFAADVEAIQQLLATYGGYVESLYQYGEEGSLYGRSVSLSMRVPSEHLDTFVSGVSGFGKVISRSESTQDMTEQYTDNEVRIQTLRTKMERLNTLLSQAENVSDILEIESEIADTQYQLDRYETAQLNIDRKVDMSYVYVNVQEAVVQDTVDDEDISLGQRLKAALKASVEGLIRFGRNLLVFLVMALPVIIPVAVVAVVIWLVRRNKKNKAAAAVDAAQDAAGEETDDEQ